MALPHIVKFKPSFLLSANSGLSVPLLGYFSPSLVRECCCDVSSSGRKDYLCFSARKDFHLHSLESRVKVCGLGPIKASKHGNGKEDCEAEETGNKESELMDEEERQEWRNKIREVMDKYPDIEQAIDEDERKKRMQKLLKEYPLVVDEEDPDWPEDADGWGFNFGQFFNKIKIKNVKKDDEDDENYDSDKEIVWQDDDYIRPIKDIAAVDWEETVFKDFSPLIILVHNRYKRPKENEKCRGELERAVNIIWKCNLPSPRCVAIDAVVDCDLVSALQVSRFPELIFTKAGKILYREKGIRPASELSKIMAYFYYGAAKPPFFDHDGKSAELIPSSPASK